jgi:hypothetical protein
MKQGIRVVGSILLAAALASPAWAGNGHGKGNNGNGGGGGGESMAGGLPGLEDRVEADEALIATLQGQVAALQTAVAALQTAVAALQTAVTDLQGQNNFAQVSSACAIINSSSSAGPVTAAPVATGECEVTFSKDVSGCSYVATIAGPPGEISVVGATKTIAGDSIDVFTDVPAATPANEAFNLTVTCP